MTTASLAQRVAVVGGGLIGAGWAALFALRGLDVRVYDPDPVRATQRLDVAMTQGRPVLEALGLLADTPSVPRVESDLARALEGVQLVQESLPEQLALKHAVYAEIERHVSPDTLIASSSSGILPSALQAPLAHPERLLIAHPCNPAYLMPVIEIAGGNATAPEALERADAFYQSLGKQTVRLQREIAGHLINRLQAAIWREAVHLVAEGYASAGDVDRAVTEGLGARWTVCGPNAIFHLANTERGMAGFLDQLGEAVEGWWADLGTPRLDAPTRAKLVESMNEATGGRPVAELARERDIRVVAMLRAQRDVLNTPIPTNNTALTTKTQEES